MASERIKLKGLQEINGGGELTRLARELKSIKGSLESFQKLNAKLLSRLHPQFKEGGLNLMYYLALRQINLKDLQLRLAHFGLSSLGRCESYVMDNIQQVLERISDFLRIRSSGSKSTEIVSHYTRTLTWHDAEKIMHQHTRDLFGPKPPGRHVYIMATAPSRAEFSDAWVRNILKSGANLIRVNCAHDAKHDWDEMVKSIRRTAAELKTPCRIMMDLAGPKIRTVMLAPKELSVGDRLTLVGKAPEKKKQVQCTLPEVIKFVKTGERVLFDDGKFEAKVTGRSTKKVDLEITRTPSPGAKLKSEKGINFPDSLISTSEVTKQDVRDLQFAGTHADMIGLSFVQSPEAIRKIRRELKKMTDRPPGIILKIETQAGFKALPRLLVEVMKDYPSGVMIARGDLGVEVGFERMVEVQEEILWLCEAAHVPVIWATQVLENEAKTGLPSRAELTDAASSVRAECVMLNKGPYIEAAVRTLDNIVRRMESHTYKKRNIYRKLMVAKFL
jgi:pyruvate kinase